MTQYRFSSTLRLVGLTATLAVGGAGLTMVAQAAAVRASLDAPVSYASGNPRYSDVFAGNPGTGVIDAHSDVWNPPADLGSVEIPALASNPAAPVTVYVNFTGFTITEPSPWHGLGYSRQSAPREDLVFSSPMVSSGGELTATDVYDLWVQVSEDFAPWNINVTTIAPSSDQMYREDITDDTWGVHLVVVPGSDLYDMDPTVSSRDGHAIQDAAVGTPGIWQQVIQADAIAVDRTYQSTTTLGDIISHEVGHTLGLDHAGYTHPTGDTYEYWNGALSGAWSSLMGNSTGNGRYSVWDHGSYIGASPQADYRTVFGDVLWNNPLAEHTTESLAANTYRRGIIATPEQTDTYTLTHTGSTAIITVAGLDTGNLYPQVAITDASGSSVATVTGAWVESDQGGTWNNRVSVDITGLPAGDYTVSITGTHASHPEGYLEPNNTPSPNLPAESSRGHYTVALHHPN